MNVKCPNKQKGDYFTRNPEECDRNVEKLLRAAGVKTWLEERSQPMKTQRARPHLFSDLLNLQWSHSAELNSLQTVILLYVYVLIKVCSSKQKPFVSSKENILLSGKGGTTPPHSPGNTGIPSQLATYLKNLCFLQLNFIWHFSDLSKGTA